nr:hypothetical protein [Tanacetum cinerariifolium]
MADNRTMEELLQAPTEGDVPNDVIKLMMFPYSLEGNARVWYDKEPPNSILTWEDLVNKFMNQFFPPSKTTHLKNEISCFTQRFEEIFGEACKRFKEMLRACPHHRFMELDQIDTFYNGLNDNDQDSLNAAAGRNLLSKTTREALQIIKNKSKVRYSRNKLNTSRMNTTSRDNASKSDDRIDKLADQNLTLVDIFAKKIVTPAPVKAVEEFCVTCGGNHVYYYCPNTDSNQPSVYVTTVQQGFSNEFLSYKKVNDQMMRNIQNQINSLKGEFKNEIQNTMKTQQTVLMEQQNAFQNNLQNMLSGFFQNQSSTSDTLPSNTIPNPNGEMKSITTRSGIAYKGHSIPTPKKAVERETEETTDKEQSNFRGSTVHIQPSVTSISGPGVPKTLPKPNIPYPSRLNDQKLREKATNQMEKFFQIFQDFHFDISFADALILMPKSASTIKSLLTNKDKLFELAKIPLNKNFSVMLLKKLLEKLGDLGKFLIPCDFPGMDLANRSITRPKGVSEDVFVKVGKFHFLTDFVVVDFEANPCVPLILGRSFLRTGRALIDVYGEEISLQVNDEAVTFNLNQTTRYSSTYDDLSVNRIDIIDVAREGYAQEILGFSSNSSGGNPTSTFELILSDFCPSLTPFEGSDFILEEIDAYLKDESVSLEIDQGDFDEKEALLKVLKSHKRAIAWKIADIKGIDPRFCTHKILMEEDYKPVVQSQRRVNPKIHKVIKKEVIKLLDAGMIYSTSDSPWVSTIHCVPKKGGITVVENKNNELIPTQLVTGWRVYIDYRKLNDATRKDHFPLPFMDQMKRPLSHVPMEHLLIAECPLAFEMLLGHFKDVITKLPYPTTVKGVRSFLGHGGFYRRFIQDFSKIARPMTYLLDKHTPFVFSKDCIDAFETLKKKLTEAPILVVSDWNLPFELMCDTSDFAIGAVLGQRKMKHFHPIHYASKTMTKAQIHYTTTEKEMLSVVYAIEKFRPYLVLSKSIVYTDHSALKYLLSKQDAKPRLENPHRDVFENKDINENFPLETLVKISSGSTPWFAHFENFHAGNFIVKGMSSQQKKKFFKDVKHYFWDDPYHFGYVRIKSFKGIDFMGPFPSSRGNKYILVVVDYLVKWVEAKALPTNDARVVVKFLKSLFARFGTPRAIISHRGTHFCNDKFAKVMSKYGVTHRLSTAYHP